VRSPASQGCNDLLADGAHVVRDTADVLTLLGILTAAIDSRRQPELAEPDRANVPLGPLEEAVRRALEHRPLSLDGVLSRSGASFLDAVQALEHLAALGMARQVGAGWELTSH
jgi:predicted Rossmann fold nucleotide-binding protein DprA/Smf involved in DNA uptake